MNLHFRPTFWPTVFTIPAVLLMLGLGVWQLERLQWKTAIIAERTSVPVRPPSRCRDRSGCRRSRIRPRPGPGDLPPRQGDLPRRPFPQRQCRLSSGDALPAQGRAHPLRRPRLDPLGSQGAGDPVRRARSRGWWRWTPSYGFGARRTGWCRTTGPTSISSSSPICPPWRKLMDLPQAETRFFLEAGPAANPGRLSHRRPDPHRPAQRPSAIRHHLVQPGGRAAGDLLHLPPPAAAEDQADIGGAMSLTLEIAPRPTPSWRPASTAGRR